MPNIKWCHSKQFVKDFIVDCPEERIIEGVGDQGILVDGVPYGIDDSLPEEGFYRVQGEPDSRILTVDGPGDLH